MIVFNSFVWLLTSLDLTKQKIENYAEIYFQLALYKRTDF